MYTYGRHKNMCITWSCTKCVWAAEKRWMGARADSEKRNAAALLYCVCAF